MTPDPSQHPPSLPAVGWPRSAVSGHPAAIDLWHRHFGQGLRRVRIETAEAGLELVLGFGLRRLALGTRFVFCAADRSFEVRPERRLLPLRQLSAPISLEAGNLRGALALAPDADLSSALAGLVAALARRSGWDYLTLPVPETEAPVWRAAASRAGLRSLLRSTGRVFHANLSGAEGWDGRMQQASRNDRKNEARALRRAEEAGLRLVARATSAEDMAALRHVADRASKNHRLAGAEVVVPYTARQESYLAEAIRLPGQSGLTVRLDGPEGPLAVSLWVRRGADLLGTVTCHTEASRPFSPGLLLMREAFCWARDHGIERLDFNATDPLYAGYADHRAAFCDLLLFPRGLRGRLLHRLAASRNPGISMTRSEDDRCPPA